ncbi:sulfate ABC transporter substrate-binding protein [Microcystis aeruginosa LEGE 00239]|uniref:sulfate ABC transporter substrate-binding protein n=1 Tax=Microcystis aeruginosa TaxID=1126 RepID=UPI00188035FF|nr:sulfate ABC transporter substrate-binding protein [Microcystis aeruginosa]MBE9243847.1 sulfate ABC transporter substrate-binding protein [Microcystis aeruginosa LEGE 00239]
MNVSLLPIRSLFRPLRLGSGQAFHSLLRRGFVSFLVLGLLGALALASCTSGGIASKPEVKLNLVSFSVTKAAHDQIIPKFVEKWQKERNQKVIFERSYGGSLAQADDVIAGKQEADVVHLALPLDVTRIADAGLIHRSWEDRVPRRGVVSRSVAAISRSERVATVTRAGNPKNIQSWADLAREDVTVLSADPKTSGIAIWQLLALWGSVTQTGGEPQQAWDFVRRIYQKIPTLARDAREASNAFFQEGKGDVLVTYENEVILAARNQPDINYFVPSVNISIDNPVAVVDRNVDKHGTREVAEAFVDFLYSEPAQQEFAKLGYRSVNPFITIATEAKLPPVETLFSSQDLGGWPLISNEFLAKGAIFDQIRGNSPN